MITLNDKLSGCLLGLACGDAVGTTVEFKERGAFEPLTDMVGGGPFDLKPGEWTDDTSMALCLATSLIECDGFDAGDQMERYCRWHREGYLSSNGTCFDIGGTVQAALRLYRFSGNPFAGSTDEFSAGNGSIMRLAPIPIFYSNLEEVIHFAAESSRTTHGAEECVAACQLLGAMLHQALRGDSKEEILFGAHFSQDSRLQLPPKIEAIARGDYRGKLSDNIRGSGYVTDCLEAALWCFYQTNSYREAVLYAANLGSDADTTAAVCGQIAGAYYGAAGIPADWRARIAKSYLIESLVEGLIDARKK
ncbi:ADP-ribosylglycohydrolase family protein [Coraliomargarita sp. SDUM461003]|uniref:ADP-ribosylglycohydrolase family protein n=1 Tax=Thalassobacterium maritimum TaxID=3041265 RepID=A0ABU1AUQ5_9BACT|nr:ADP-ribosylglycohydrolase family protein [Coraliomargarita sp. SDUM461003]MDQ8207882.1 ADP-ribosylglycohydrolase family protein [Coraliomargarita sp. SDUM461003]